MSTDLDPTQLAIEFLRRDLRVFLFPGAQKTKVYQ